MLLYNNYLKRNNQFFMTILQIIGYLTSLVFIFYLMAKVVDDYFVNSLEIITEKLKLSSDVAGATFMAIGSSAPELFTAIIALTKVGSEQIGAGTIVGSAIFNILVIVGASAAVTTAYLNWQPVIRDMGFYIVSIIVLLFTFSDGKITLYEAIFYLLAYIVYLIVLYNWKKIVPKEVKKKNNSEENVFKHEEIKNSEKTMLKKIDQSISSVLGKLFPDLEKKPHLYMLTFFISIIVIAILSWLMVESAVLLARLLNISETIIALTILAAGTSIPDLLSSVIVAKKGYGGMAISNAVGSNTFDILIGLGLPWLGYIIIKKQDIVVNTENLMSSIILLFATVIALLFIIAVQKFKIGKKSGYILLVLYVLYLVYAIYHAIYPESIDISTYLSNIITNVT